MQPPFTLVEEALKEWLPQVATQGDRLLEASRVRLDTEAGFLPEWLAIRRLGLQWRCQSRFEGSRSRFLFWTRRTSAREMLDAEIEVRLQPSPFAEGVPSRPVEGGIRLVFPRLVLRAFTPEEFRAWTPPGAVLRRSLILRLGPEEILSCCDSRTAGQGGLAEHIRARWIRRGAQRDLGPKGMWPLRLLRSVVRALAAEGSLAPADAKPYAALDTRLEVWQITDAAVQLALALPSWLEPEEPREIEEPLRPLRCRWGVGHFALRAGALVSPEAAGGRLARASDGDTFLAPFRVAWEERLDGPQLSVVLEPPDVVARGELRTRLLEAYAGSQAMRSLAKRFNEAVPGAGLTPDDVAAWCVPDNANAQVVRIDRRESGADEYLLALPGRAGPTSLLGLVQSETQEMAFEEGRLVVRLGSMKEVFAGRDTGQDLNWEPSGRLLCDLLSILLRWRFLLP